MAERRPRFAVAVPVVAAAAGLVAVAMAAKSGTPLASTVQPLSELKLKSITLPSSAEFSGRAPDFRIPGAGGLLWLVAIGSVLVTILVVVALLLALRALFGRPTRVSRGRRAATTGATLPDGGDAAADELRSRLRGEVMAGLEDLDETGDPRRAVIACWLRLERAVAEAGTPRRSSETPGDLVARVLAEHRVRPERLERLTTLYREARYSRHDLDEDVRRAARAALEDVRHDLSDRSAVPG